MAERVWTIGGLLQWTEQFLAQKGVESPRLDAQILLAHALGCDRIHLYTRFDEPADDNVRTGFRDLVRRRVEGCPVAYLVGRKEFYKLTFEVTPAVLIPRPATESLVLAALERLKPLAAPRVLDLGTGSGCIAVSVARQHAGAAVVAVDASADALAVARRNAERHGVAGRIDFRAGDLFAPVAGETFDLIVSNPPYIPTRELEVKCQDERSQHKNYERAMRILRTRLYERQQQRLHRERAEVRRTMIGSGDRNERIRTYNFPQNRVTDHRIELTLYNLSFVMEGQVDPIIEPLMAHDLEERLAALKL